MAQIRTVLFDLDGTLLDTAPDMAAALNAVLAEEGFPQLPFAHIRGHVSHGSNALVKLGFGQEQDEADFQRRRQRFLDVYNENLHLDTELFPGMASLLAYIERHGMNWGVVTNKPAFLTDPLMASLGLAARAACIVSGDTTDERKPHPKPMLHACELAGSHADECVYVGDASRDIEAGRRAGMATLVALYGYINEFQKPEEWGADAMINEPREILDWLLEADPQRAAL
ncbi:MAG TPA: phosphoglycolate phosphatase [Thioalkalivibrio sp.]|nr:phosphoglycolate phosphatase [Thioalkalivibrio sp.]